MSSSTINYVVSVLVKVKFTPDNDTEILNDVGPVYRIVVDL